MEGRAIEFIEATDLLKGNVRNLKKTVGLLVIR